MERLNVLVTDDELGMRLGVQRVLRDHVVSLPEFDTQVAFDVQSCESAEQALNLIQSKSFDLLLLDHKLPSMQGLELLDLVSGGHRDLLTIMITAYASIDAAVSATKRGAFDFLAKPFTPDELKSTVRKATRHLMLQRQARTLAVEKQKLRFQLVSVVSHELKSPLAAIEGYLRLIKDGTAGSDPGDYQRMIDRSLVRLDGMRKLISDLLDLTRIESGNRERNVQPVDVCDTARDSIENAAPFAAERSVSLHLLTPPGELTVLADPSELSIIFDNLITNAIKYNRLGGRVDMVLRDAGESVVIDVTDTGIGMTPEECSRLFREFSRIKNSKTRDILGSGLGLSILKRLALLYGGEIQVHSEPDVGSTFTVTLSREQRASQRPPAPSGAVPLLSLAELAEATAAPIRF